MTNSGPATNGLNPRHVAALVALGVLVLFIALNFEEVTIDLLIVSQTMRLGFALIFAGALGFLVGYFLPKGRGSNV